uniref:Uncharacterized protein n=1 Tax=Meloidogyne enterolobii TaxID=390850 RepID=A0A6V7V0L7_MELEN|nr:unnamed protein product [Meloidogyne enterolobii]
MSSQKILKIFVLTVLLHFYSQLVESGVTKDKNIHQHHEATPIQPVAPPTNIVASPIQPHAAPPPNTRPHSGFSYFDVQPHEYFKGVKPLQKLEDPKE